VEIVFLRAVIWVYILLNYMGQLFKGSPVNLGFYDIFRFITVFLFLFFSIFLLSLKKGNILSNKLFAVFLFSKSLCFSNSLLFRFKEYLVPIVPYLYYIGESFEFLLGPSLYLYVKSLAYRDFKLKKLHLLHLIPFFVHFIFMSYKFHMYDFDTKIQMLSGYILSLNEYLIDISAVYLHFIVYSIAVLIVLFKYKSDLKNLFSYIEKMKLTWLSILTAGFIVLWGTSFVHFILRMSGHYFSYPRNLSIVLLFSFANLIMYKGLKQPEIFAGIPGNGGRNRAQLSETASNSYLNQLQQYMAEQKPFLIPSLSITDLAEKLSIPQRTLSYLINEKLNQNFFDFMNNYRVEEAKRLLLAKENTGSTILEIAFEAGFNSKSAFNSIFKKYVGMPPSIYQRKAIHN